MIRAHVRQRPKNPGGVGGGGGFAPSTLFATGEQGIWYDPSDLLTMFQDSAGTVPVTAAGQVVGRILDKSGNGNHATQATEASKPILRNTGALWWLEFDGVDDYLETAAINFTATDKMSAWAGQRKMSDAAAAVLFELSANINLNDGAFAINAPNAAASASYTVRSKGTMLRDLTESTFTAPVTNVLFMTANISGDMLSGHVDSVVFGPIATDQGAGNYGNYPLYIGRRGGVALPFNGLIYGLIIRGAISDSLTVLGAERYMGSKSGVVL